MGMRINAELPLPADLKAEYPLSDKIIKIKEKLNWFFFFKYWYF